MSQLLQKIDHINIVVKDLERVKGFFMSLGFELHDRARLKGDWISQIVGLEDVDAEYVRLALPGDSMFLELICFDNPPINEIDNPDKANTQGFRHLAFQVNDIEKTVAALQESGVEPLSTDPGIYQNREKTGLFSGAGRDFAGAGPVPKVIYTSLYIKAEWSQPMIHVIASIQVKEDQMAKFMEIFKANIPNVLQEEGCIEYFPTVDIPTGLPPQDYNPNVATIIESWHSLDDLKAHLTAPHMLDYKEKVKDIVEDMSVKVLERA